MDKFRIKEKLKIVYQTKERIKYSICNSHYTWIRIQNLMRDNENIM